jgi:hypothetical protein
MKKLILLLVLVAATAVAVGCQTSQSLEDRAIGLAKADLAQHLGVSEQSIEVVTVEKVEWPGPNLGLPAKPGPTPEASLPVIVPGWQIVFVVDEAQYEYRVGEVSEGDLKLIRLDTEEGDAGAKLAPEREKDKPGYEWEAGIPEEPTWPPEKKSTPEEGATID